ncbi:MAG: 2-vinyl bacteriochlorophyllide hydratase [Gemmatimonadetes bacterium]|nr:2-vinyl bacteriochlorophyllide hydratase [Gemmatimonadota bacterium]
MLDTPSRPPHTRPEPASPPAHSVPDRGDPLARAPLYTPVQRARRDASPWTRVQAVLAPLQVLVMLASAVLVLRYLGRGVGYDLATGSVLLKTALLYAIMVTGSIWEKDVFGRWLFAPAFFWEDVVSMVVVALHTVYLFGLFGGWMSERSLMALALLAYAVYAVNALQFVLKLRRARLEPLALLGPEVAR